jgi:beta-glucosidase
MKEEKNTDIFPKHFFWGASTSSHQVEGGNHNQWTVWELARASEMAQTAHRRLSEPGNFNWAPRWEQVKDQAEEPDNYVSGRGVEHYSRYREDFDLIKELNLNAFRFGIEWARIEPEEGKWDNKEIAHYKEYISELRKRHIEPFINIWHWTEPVWFAEKGGFEKRDNLVYFERFVQKLADELIDEIGYVIVLNEPNVYATFGYLSGDYPPGKKNIWTTFKVIMNLVQAQKRAYKILKRAKPILQIGMSPQLANIQAKRPHSLLDEISTKVMRYLWNWWFLYRIRKYQDFLGFNYYFSDYYVGLGKRKNPRMPISDVGWYMEPEGVYPLIMRAWARFKKPIFITENGLADADDQYRRWWIEETIVAMERALSEGADIRGYFHWSLLDNFEWALGWWPKFGLIEVDREHDMKRKIRPSARWFAATIKKISSS